MTRANWTSLSADSGEFWLSGINSPELIDSAASLAAWTGD
jgi:hypothetical protein